VLNPSFDADSGNEVVYTLPYSPRLNPIEQFFNQLKHYMKVERSMNLRELKESVKRALENSLSKLLYVSVCISVCVCVYVCVCVCVCV
jgi:transposase